MSNGNTTPPSPRRPVNDDSREAPKPPRSRNFTGYVLIVVLVVIVVFVLRQAIGTEDKMTFPEFMNRLVQGRVQKVEVEKNIVKVTFKQGAKDGKLPAESPAPKRVVIPEKLLVDKAILLEELAELGSRISPINDEILALFVRKLQSNDESTGIIVFRRILIPDQPVDDSKNTDKRDLMLIELARLGDSTPAQPEASRQQSSVYLIPTGQHRLRLESDGAEKAYTLTLPDLLRLTTTDKENLAHGLPLVADVTEILPLSKGLIGFAEDAGLWETIIVSLAPWILMILFFWFFLFRQMRSNSIGGNVLSFGRSRARIANREKSNVTFADVAGIEEAKEEVEEIVEFLKHPGRFSRLGGRIPRGVLLVGPPGNGKTLLAKAIAGEADVPFFSICGSDFVEMFVGVGASRVRDLFKQARENAPCIIFLDEIDAVGRRRGAGLGGGHDEREQTLNAILVEMDGFETDAGVIVIAATNRADVLDPALLRPGRFDREIHVDLPDIKGREAILRVHARKVKLFPGVDLTRIARGTPGFSGAELEAVVNEAAILAVMAKKDFVYEEDLEEARDRVRWGRSKQSRVMDPADLKVTAFHEAGHTLMAYLTPRANPPHKVTIIPRGRALGATLMLPEKDQYSYSQAQAEAMLKVAFGGRVAEEIVFGEITSGASDDIKRATELARTMVVEWGMSPLLGPINLSDNDEPVFLGRDFNRQTRFGEATVDAIDKEIKRIIDQTYQATRQTLTDHRDKLETISRELIRYEVLTREEIEGLMSGETVEAVRKRRLDVIKSADPQRITASSPIQNEALDTPPSPSGLAPEGA